MTLAFLHISNPDALWTLATIIALFLALVYTAWAER